MSLFHLLSYFKLTFELKFDNMINPNDRLLVISTSTIHGYSFLEYIKDEIKEFIQSDEIIFFFFLRPSGISYDDFTQSV